MDMAQWFNWYSFDVMGELGFGASFDVSMSLCLADLFSAFRCLGFYVLLVVQQ